MVLPHTNMNPPQVYTCSPSWTLLPPHTIPLGRPSAPAPSIQYRSSNLDWRLILCMILYMFQCHSPKSSHPQSPKDCSTQQCLFCCLVYRVIVAIFLNSIYTSIRLFSNESTLLMRWPKYWSFSFSISPSSEHPGLISFRMDWLDILAVQGTLKSLLQHHSSKASILRRSAFFTVRLSHPYMTTGKTIALTRRTFVGKVMSLLLNMYLGWS